MSVETIIPLITLLLFNMCADAIILRIIPVNVVHKNTIIVECYDDNSMLSKTKLI